MPPERQKYAVPRYYRLKTVSVLLFFCGKMELCREQIMRQVLPPREAARACAAYRKNSQAVRYGTVRYSTYSAVKNYITYGTQQYRTVRKQIRYAVVRYNTYGTVR